jgi:arylsulfatase
MPPGESIFQGVIGRTYQESTPSWPQPTQAPAGAPNIVFILLDDVGFAHFGCYGSDIETPNMDRLATGGLL